MYDGISVFIGRERFVAKKIVYEIRSKVVFRETKREVQKSPLVVKAHGNIS